MSGKFLFFLLIFSAGALTANCQTKSDAKIKPCKYLSFAEAEKILGQKVELITNSWTFTSDASKLDCHYRAIENDKVSEREINLFFMLEESATETQAKEIYARFWESNKNHAGIEPLSGIGDQAYAHSDKTGFHFVLARKGKFTLRMKINKANEATSLEELKTFAKRVIDQI